jgi:hypothetical protein
MVTSQKIGENIMGYHGSKSSTRVLVKEQRADGSWYDNSQSVTFVKQALLCSESRVNENGSYLRCALMGGESHYQVGIPSNLELAKATYSTLSIFKLINP